MIAASDPTGLNDQLECMQADGRITPDDADEVRTFAAFLADVGPGPGKPGHDPARRMAALRRHYPDEAAAVDAALTTRHPETTTSTETETDR